MKKEHRFGMWYPARKDESANCTEYKRLRSLNLKDIRDKYRYLFDNLSLKIN